MRRHFLLLVLSAWLLFQYSFHVLAVRGDASDSAGADLSLSDEVLISFDGKDGIGMQMVAASHLLQGRKLGAVHRHVADGANASMNSTGEYSAARDRRQGNSLWHHRSAGLIVSNRDYAAAAAIMYGHRHYDYDSDPGILNECLKRDVWMILGISIGLVILLAIMVEVFLPILLFVLSDEFRQYTCLFFSKFMEDGVWVSSKRNHGGMRRLQISGAVCRADSHEQKLTRESRKATQCIG